MREWSEQHIKDLIKKHAGGGNQVEFIKERLRYLCSQMRKQYAHNVTVLEDAFVEGYGYDYTISGYLDVTIQSYEILERPAATYHNREFTKQITDEEYFLEMGRYLGVRFKLLIEFYPEEQFINKGYGSLTFNGGGRFPKNISERDWNGFMFGIDMQRVINLDETQRPDRRSAMTTNLNNLSASIQSSADQYGYYTQLRFSRKITSDDLRALNGKPITFEGYAYNLTDLSIYDK